MVEGYFLVLDDNFETAGLLKAANNQEHDKAVVASGEVSRLEGRET